MTVVRLAVLAFGVALSLGSVTQQAAPPAVVTEREPAPRRQPKPPPEEPAIAAAPVDPAITTQIDQERNLRALELAADVSPPAADPEIHVTYSVPVGKAHGSYERPPRQDRIAVTDVSLSSRTRWPSGAEECHQGEIRVDGRATRFAQVASHREIEAHTVMRERLTLEIDPDTLAAMAGGREVLISLCALRFPLSGDDLAHVRALAAAAGLL